MLLAFRTQDMHIQWCVKLVKLYLNVVLLFQVLQDAMTVLKLVEEQNTRVSVWLVVEAGLRQVGILSLMK